MKLPVLIRPRGRHRTVSAQDQIEILETEVRFLRQVAANRRTLNRQLGEDLAEANRRILDYQERLLQAVGDPMVIPESSRFPLTIVAPSQVLLSREPEPGSASGLPLHMVGRGHLHSVRLSR